MREVYDLCKLLCILYGFGFVLFLCCDVIIVKYCENKVVKFIRGCGVRVKFVFGFKLE